ncbi:MAG: hypothetical protein A2017_09985 [Lentisphaerae bacterium GWF2_44_16]|nr:MAG: hypothetical protein A2017_09985 [Lentisphaerae bacterium GWF2_44_16]
MTSHSKMCIIIDSREQEAYAFSSPSVRRKLDAGDYSLEGFENKVAVERKTLDDFVNTVLRGHDRFYQELRSLQNYDHACVVIESNLRDLIEGNYRSGVHPNAMLATVIAININFKIPVFFCGDRQAACRFVEEYLKYFYRKYTNE